MVDAMTRGHAAAVYALQGNWFRGMMSSLRAKLLAVALILVTWQILYLSGWKSPVVLPGPAAVVANLCQQVQEPLLWQAVWTTLNRALLGFGLALLIGAIAGALVARNGLLRAALGPIITGLQTMPAIAWFPFAIIFFGLNTSAILFVIVIGAAPRSPSA